MEQRDIPVETPEQDEFGIRFSADTILRRSVR